MSGALESERPDAGMHVVVRFGPRVDDNAVAAAAAELGISCMPLSSCFIGHHKASGLVLGFAGYKPHQIRSGMRKLSAAIGDQTRSRIRRQVACN